mmetsp:Transcript_28335/g.49857  ORF Transcript_28335/g.49857 Transcript_28335/m.49857 type:complete len:89 (-) Transcript_28335:972-1238(-)
MIKKFNFIDSKKAKKLASTNNIITLKVQKKFNKNLLKIFFREFFDINTQKINTLNSYRSYKKAYVKLNKNADALKIIKYFTNSNYKLI